MVSVTRRMPHGRTDVSINDDASAHARAAVAAAVAATAPRSFPPSTAPGPEVAQVGHQLGLEGVLEGRAGGLGRPASAARAAAGCADDDCGAASPLPEDRRRGTAGAPSGAEASESDTLPWGSMSSTRTSTAWPSVSTSSTLLMRLPPASDDSFEMCSRPSRPGSTLTKAPNLVMLTTLPG